MISFLCQVSNSAWVGLHRTQYRTQVTKIQPPETTTTNTHRLKLQFHVLNTCVVPFGFAVVAFPSSRPAGVLLGSAEGKKFIPDMNHSSWL